MRGTLSTRCCSRASVPPVAQHDARAPHADLPGLSRGQRFPALPFDADLGPRERPSRGSDLEAPPLVGVGGDDGARLREAVPLVDGDSQGIEPAHVFDGARRAAGNHEDEPSSQGLADPSRYERAQDEVGRPRGKGHRIPADAMGSAVEPGAQRDGRGEQRRAEPSFLLHLVGDVLSEVFHEGGNHEEVGRPDLLHVARNVPDGSQLRGARLHGRDEARLFQEAVQPCRVGEGVVPGQDEEHGDRRGEREHEVRLRSIDPVVEV